MKKRLIAALTGAALAATALSAAMNWGGIQGSGFRQDYRVTASRLVRETRSPALKITLGGVVKRDGQDIYLQVRSHNEGERALLLSSDFIRAEDEQGRIYYPGLSDDWGVLAAHEERDGILGFTLPAGSGVTRLYVVNPL